jgi:DNA-binding response OmpR family regulator
VHAGPKRILVVDDENTIRELIADALREFDYDVETAQNGFDALEAVGRSTPDAIVLDLMMPRLDGDRFVELVERITVAPIAALTDERPALT